MSEEVGERVPLSLEGSWNFLLLGVVIGAVFLPTPWREIAMLAASGVSVWKTPKPIREKNEFTYHPIEEVAILFAGIFATMIPALLILVITSYSIHYTKLYETGSKSGKFSPITGNGPTPPISGGSFPH